MDPIKLFDLTSFSHASLFEGASCGSIVLNRLVHYLEETTTGTSLSFDGVVLLKKELITLGNNVVIEPGAYIEGPCIIGDNSVIRHGAYIRGGALIGSHCVVGHASEIKHSILLDHAKAPHFNYIGDSIIGNYVNLGAGVITANVRFDRKEIQSTGRTKCGAFVGDNTQVGCNVVLIPGKCIPKESHIYPQKARVAPKFSPGSNERA